MRNYDTTMRLNTSRSRRFRWFDDAPSVPRSFEAPATTMTKTTKDGILATTDVYQPKSRAQTGRSFAQSRKVQSSKFRSFESVHHVNMDDAEERIEKLCGRREIARLAPSNKEWKARDLMLSKSNALYFGRLEAACDAARHMYEVWAQAEVADLQGAAMRLFAVYRQLPIFGVVPTEVHASDQGLH